MLAEYRYQGWTLGFTGNYVPTMYNFVSVESQTVPQSSTQLVAAYFQIDSRLSYSFAAPKTIATPSSVVDPKGGPVRSRVLPAGRWYHGLTLTVGCNNLFNQQPPFVSGANGNTDLSFYDPFGRSVYFQVAKKF
jgi:outer membrane receptor protein involved in Fe transport